MTPAQLLGRGVGRAALSWLLVLLGCAEAAPTRGGWADAEPPWPASGAFEGEDELTYLQGALPALWLEVGPVPEKGAAHGTMKVILDNDGTPDGVRAAVAVLETRVDLSFRGQSSRHYYLQKPYKLELMNETGGSPAKRRLLGLPADSTFVLHSCYSDKSCLRNALSYAIGREMGRERGEWWSPRTRYVELYKDGQYEGLYLLVEKIKVSAGRLDLPRPADSAALGDLSGGYAISLEGNKSRGPGRDWQDAIAPKANNLYRFPTYQDLTVEQRAYLQSSFAGLRQALIQDPDPAGPAGELIDSATWVDYVLMQELSGNKDAYWKSFYLYKKPDALGGRWNFGPIWDFDIGYGNQTMDMLFCPTYLSLERIVSPFKEFMLQAKVLDALQCRYRALRLRGGPLDPARIDGTIEAFAAHIRTAKERDQARWGTIGKYVWPNNYVGETWEDEVSFLRYWIHRRLDALDQLLPGSCPGQLTPEPVAILAQPPLAAQSAPRDVDPKSGLSPVFLPLEGVNDPNQYKQHCFAILPESPSLVTGFEQGEPQPTYRDAPDPISGRSKNVGGYGPELTGPQLQQTSQGLARTGGAALVYSGQDLDDKVSFAYLMAFDVNLPIGPRTTLRYWIYPQSGGEPSLNAAAANSTCVAVDLVISGGAVTRNVRGLVDQNGVRLHPAAYCGKLTPDAWNEVVVDLGSVLAGRRVLRVDVGYDQGPSKGGYHGFIDDLSIQDRQ